MNILYILHSTYPLGGASKSFLTLIKGVQEQGHTPIVVAPDADGCRGNNHSLPHQYLP